MPWNIKFHNIFGVCLYVVYSTTMEVNVGGYMHPWIHHTYRTTNLRAYGISVICTKHEFYPFDKREGVRFLFISFTIWLFVWRFIQTVALLLISTMTSHYSILSVVCTFSIFFLLQTAICDMRFRTNHFYGNV